VHAALVAVGLQAELVTEQSGVELALIEIGQPGWQLLAKRLRSTGADVAIITSAHATMVDLLAALELRFVSCTLSAAPGKVKELRQQRAWELAHRELAAALQRLYTEAGVNAA
jgi:hypothetical protein